MTLKRTIVILSIAALTAAGVLGVITYRAARAATPTTAPTLAGLAHFGPGRGPGGGYTREDLANALGISVDELNQAYQEATNAALDEAVKAGLITQAQADQLRSQGFAFPFGARWMGWLQANGIDFDALLAESLGITVDKLKEAYLQAYNTAVDRAVSEGRLTQEQGDLLKGRYALFSSDSFRSAMQSAFEAAVKKAVEEGVISQAQADLILKYWNSRGFPGFGGFHGFGKFGGFGYFGRPGWRGGMNSFPSPLKPSVTPSGGL